VKTGLSSWTMIGDRLDFVASVTDWQYKKKTETNIIKCLHYP